MTLYEEYKELQRFAEKEERVTKKADRLFALRAMQDVPDEENEKQWARDKERFRRKEEKKKRKKVDDEEDVRAPGGPTPLKLVENG